MPRPAFEIMYRFWVDLLRERGLPPAVRWLFYEDKARMRRPPSYPYPGAVRFVFRPRLGAEAEQIARFAYQHLDPKYPLAIVAYARSCPRMISAWRAGSRSSRTSSRKLDYSYCVTSISGSKIVDFEKHSMGIVATP
jgi:hypothetical protein